MRTTLWSLELRPDEGHHVGARDPHRRLVHRGEEHLQVEGHGQAGVGPCPSGQELQVLVDQRMADGHLQRPGWIQPTGDTGYPTHGRPPSGTLRSPIVITRISCVPLLADRPITSSPPLASVRPQPPAVRWRRPRPGSGRWSVLIRSGGPVCLSGGADHAHRTPGRMRPRPARMARCQLGTPGLRSSRSWG